VNGSTVEHIPVLAKTLAEQINLPLDGVMVDATIGHGSHSYLFGITLGSEGVIVGLDVDENAIRRAQLKLKDLACKVILVHSNFSQISEQIRAQGIEEVDFILADLGVSSAQLSDVELGLSFQTNMPLDMRIDQRLKTTAAEFGQDRASRRIARFIVRHRCREPIATTVQPAAIVCRALSRPGQKRKPRIHPATRTFQALRIAVNNELENLERLLVSAPSLLRKNGRIAIISFHSLEDRLVKKDFKQNEDKGIYKIITKKPIVPTQEEIGANPRSRSAKLRIAERR